MKVLAILGSVLLVVAGQSPVRFSLNVPGIDAWRLALDQHAAAEGRLTGFVRTPAGHTPSFPAVPRPPVPPPTPPVTVPAHIAGNVNFQGIPQWQLHQQAVLTAERQLEQLQTTPSPMTTTSMAPEISSSSADPLDRVTKNTKIVENFIAEIQSDTSGGKTSAIAQLLQQVKNKSKKVAVPVQSSRSAASVEQFDDLIKAAPGRPRSFLDNLLSTLTAKPVEEEEEEDVVTNEIEQEDLVEDQVKDQVTKEDSISEILKLLTAKESKPQKKKKVEKEESNSDILALLSGVAPKPKTKTSQPKLSLAELLSLDLPASSPAKKKEILRPTKEDILAESIVAQLFSNDEEQSSAVNIGRASNQDQLANEINEFLDILAEIDPSLDRSKSVVNSRLSVVDEEEERRGRVSAKAPRVSNFIQEELTEAAEESVQLSDDLDQLLRELEVEKKKDLKFVEETYDIINAKLKG